MIVAIFHKANPNNILAKFEARDKTDAFEQYLKHHPELDCETVSQFAREFPFLAESLISCPLS